MCKYFLALLILFAGCKKENTTQPEASANKLLAKWEWVKSEKS